MTATATVEWTSQVTDTIEDNWLIYRYFAIGDYDTSLALADESLVKSFRLNDLALFIKGRIMQHKGDIMGALELFQAASIISPGNAAYLVDVARCMYVEVMYVSYLVTYSDVTNKL